MHRQLEKAAERYDFSQEENVARFTRLLRKYKVEELLEAAGAVPGDTVSIGYKDFDFYPDYYPDELPDDEPDELIESEAEELSEDGTPLPDTDDDEEASEGGTLEEDENK